MHKKSFPLTLAGIFAAASMAAAGAALTASVQSKNATPQDDFHDVIIISGAACDTNGKGASIKITGQDSESDFTALEHSVLPPAMWDMNKKEMNDYIKTLPKAEGDRIVAQYMALLGPFYEAYDRGSVAAYDEMRYRAMDKNLIFFDRAEALKTFRELFQRAADNVERAGVSMRYTIEITDDLSMDNYCRDLKNNPQPP